MPPKEGDVDHWFALAEEARRHAEQMTDADAKREMLTIAAAYRRLAEHAGRSGKKARRE